METPKGRSIGSRPASQSNDVPSPISTYVLGPTEFKPITSHNFTNQTLLSRFVDEIHSQSCAACVDGTTEEKRPYLIENEMRRSLVRVLYSSSVNVTPLLSLSRKSSFQSQKCGVPSSRFRRRVIRRGPSRARLAVKRQTPNQRRDTKKIFDENSNNQNHSHSHLCTSPLVTLAPCTHSIEF